MLESLTLKGQKSNRANEEEHARLVIIGSGPAGLSAALYAARAELAPVVITGIQPGGQAAQTFNIENYPGFPDGIGGPALVELFQKQAEKFGANVIFDTVSRVDLSSRPYKVDIYGKTYLAESLIITTGATPNHLNVPGESDLTGKGVSYCATCDGWFFKEKSVVVVGGGDSALEEALFLTRFAKDVTIVHRRDELRAGAILQRRALAHEKIHFKFDSVVTSINGTKQVESVTIKNVKTGAQEDFSTDGVFIFIGHKPNSDLFKGQIEMDESGYIVVDKKMQTSLPGVFAAGEICDPIYRQVVTSAGMGAATAIMATHYLENA